MKFYAQSALVMMNEIHFHSSESRKGWFERSEILKGHSPARGVSALAGQVP
jgi:hypothetical protein